MNENTSPNSNPKPAAPKVPSLCWKDLPGCAVLISRTIMSSDEAIVMVDGGEQVRLLLFWESLRGWVGVIVERGTVPSDKTLLAMERTIMALFAAVPAWRDGP